MRSQIQNIIRQSPEYVLHCLVSNLLNTILNSEWTCWSSVENSNHTGGTLGMIKQAKDKRKGVKKGFPDIIIMYSGTCLCIELKAGKNTTTDIQDAFHDRIRQSGNNVEVARSIDDVLMLLRKHKVPLLIK